MQMYDDKKHVEDTFDQTKLSEYLLQAQWAEFIELKKVISALNRTKLKAQVPRCRDSGRKSIKAFGWHRRALECHWLL